jgi:hypothetical protein
MITFPPRWGSAPKPFARQVPNSELGADEPVRFEKKVSPRKFKGYVTDVQMTLEEKERVQEAAVA